MRSFYKILKKHYLFIAIVILLTFFFFEKRNVGLTLENSFVQMLIEILFAVIIVTIPFVVKRFKNNKSSS